MHDEELLTAFNHSLDALAAGEAVATILARYPALRAELEPMLAAADSVRDHAMTLDVPRHVENTSRARFLARAAALRERRQRPMRAAMRWGLWAWAAAHRVAVVALALVVVMGAVGYGAAAAGSSLPGDRLYEIKRALEASQLALAASPEARDRLESEFAARRVAEVERLAAAGRTASVAFAGMVEVMDGERWTVAGLPVRVNAATVVVGLPEVGKHVSVEGTLVESGLVEAARVVVSGLVISGEVRSQAADRWEIGDLSVGVDSQTVILGTIEVGDRVRARVRTLPDGRLLALHIALAPEEETAPPPTASATVTKTPATPAAPTAVPTRTNTPGEVAPTAAATPTSTVTQAPLPSATPQPTDDDDGDDGDDGGGDDDDDNSGPSASNTPRPDETDEPDETEEPDDDD